MSKYAQLAELIAEKAVKAEREAAQRGEPPVIHKSGPLKGNLREPWHMDCQNCCGAGGSGMLDDEQNCVGMGCHTPAAQNQDYGAGLAAAVKSAVLRLRAAHAESMTAGTRVLISGLKNRPELNGTNGVVLSFQPNRGRLAVKLPSEESILLKPANMTEAQAQHSRHDEPNDNPRRAPCSECEVMCQPEVLTEDAKRCPSCETYRAYSRMGRPPQTLEGGLKFDGRSGFYCRLVGFHYGIQGRPCTGCAGCELTSRCMGNGCKWCGKRHPCAYKNCPRCGVLEDSQEQDRCRRMFSGGGEYARYLWEEYPHGRYRSRQEQADWDDAFKCAVDNDYL